MQYKVLEMAAALSVILVIISVWMNNNDRFA